MYEIEPRTNQGENVLLRKDGKPRSTRQCSRIMKSGERCKKAPIYGGTVCSKHGGRAPHIKQAAKRRLEEAADRAAAALLGMAFADDTPHAVKLSALKDALDRAGLSPQQAMQITHELKPYEVTLGKLHRGPRPGTGGEGGDSDPDDDIVDAEIVEDGYVEDDGPEGPPCTGCGVPFLGQLPSHLDEFPELCAACRAKAAADPRVSRQRRPEPDPRPSPSRYDTRYERHLESGPPPRVHDRTATPGAGEFGLMSDEQAAALAAQGRRRSRSSRRV